MTVHPAAAIFPRMSVEEFIGLKADIRARGLLEPVWVYQNQILDGRHRVQACDEIGIAWSSREYTGDDPVGFVVALNLKRRHLNDSQRQMVAASVANLPKGANQHSPIGESTTQQKAADLLNVSKRGVERAVAVKQQGIPELIEAVQQGRVSVSAAADVAELPKIEQEEIVAKGEREILDAAKRIRGERASVVALENDRKRREALALPLPPHVYRTVAIDPPWPIEINDRDVRPDQVGMHYPTMSVDEIKAIRLPLADEAIVFLWTTQKFLPAAFSVLEAWGLKYLFTMVWHKSGGPQPFNLPQYNCEFVLVGRRGGLPFLDTKQFSTCFEAPRREHSRKPDFFYELVERVSAAPRLDYFSREKRNGFDQFGNEVEKFDELDEIF
jgi:N6-adenosine-specific RNA methylase IME4